MNKIKQFGENIDGFSIPVLNEREIRAAAGILFFIMFVSIVQAGQGNFTFIKYAVTLFMLDMSIRLFVNPRYSPFLFLGRMIVIKQNPEYVGAEQKKFAWYIGFAISSAIFIQIVLTNTYSPISGIACMLCLFFLFFETAFGICIGCKLYSLVKGKKAQYCPGEVCEVKNRTEIQKLSSGQFLSTAVFILILTIVIFLFNDYFSLHPSGIWYPGE